MSAPGLSVELDDEVAAAITDPDDRRHARRAVGLLHEANVAGLLIAADVHVAQRLAQLAGEPSEQVQLAVALAVRGVRTGSVCVDLAALPQLHPELPWPDPEPWLSAVAASPLVGDGRPLRLDLGMLYLDRYFRQEVGVCADLLGRERREPPVVDRERLRHNLDQLFGEQDAEQRRAAEVAATRWTTVLGGGPGTGKTTTVARLLATLTGPAPDGSAAIGGAQVDGGEVPLRIALAAPTGKAAARLQEAVQQAVDGFPEPVRAALGELSASTLHRLLGYRPGSATRFRHDRENRLPHDVVVVDESSMLSLTLMARLLEAMRPDARLILVGDPDQLASVEAGAVLADLVAGLTAAPDATGGASPVVMLERTHRFGGAIADLAAAVRAGDTAAAVAVLDRADPAVTLLDAEAATSPTGAVRAAVVAAAQQIQAAARAGDAAGALAAMGRHRVLCAHRTGPFGVDQWARLVERWRFDAGADSREGLFYVGRPVLLTANDYALKLFNGDTGVVVQAPDGERRVAFPRGGGTVDIAPGRLSELLTVHAMTVHRSQGSQFDEVAVVLPPLDSELATREMLYTALTRAQRTVRLVGTREQLEAAIRRPAARASGLRQRLAQRTG